MKTILLLLAAKALCVAWRRRLVDAPMRECHVNFI
jgi:hypothetical protein